MALELETAIMEEIGLGNHHSWYSGSGSCRFIRQEAAEKLPDIIRKHKLKGDSVAEPDERLCEALKEIAQVGDTSEYSLTKTWKAASYVIATHIHQAGAEPEKRAKSYGQLLSYLQKSYLSGRRADNSLNLNLR